jgi:hypothetical protein
MKRNRRSGPPVQALAAVTGFRFIPELMDAA